MVQKKATAVFQGEAQEKLNQGKSVNLSSSPHLLRSSKQTSSKLGMAQSSQEHRSNQKGNSKKRVTSKRLQWWFENLPFPSEDQLELCLREWSRVGDEYQPRLTSYTYKEHKLIKLELGSTWTQVLREKGDQIWLTSPPVYRSISSEFQQSTDPQTQLFRHLRVVGCLRQIGGLIHDPELMTTWTEQEWLGVLRASSLSPWMILRLFQSEDGIEVTGLDRLGESNLQLDFSPPLYDLKKAVIWAFNPQEEHSQIKSSQTKQQEFVLDPIEEKTKKECTSSPLQLSFQKRVECRLLFLKNQSNSVHQSGPQKSSKRLKHSKKDQEDIWVEFPRLRSLEKTLSQSKRALARSGKKAKRSSVRRPSRSKKRKTLKSRKTKRTRVGKKNQKKKRRRKTIKPKHQKEKKQSTPFKFEYK